MLCLCNQTNLIGIPKVNGIHCSFECTYWMQLASRHVVLRWRSAAQAKLTRHRFPFSNAGWLGLPISTSKSHILVQRLFPFIVIHTGAC